MKDVIIGHHSIYHALQNTTRVGKRIFCTDDSLKEFKKKYHLDSQINVESFKKPDMVNKLFQQSGGQGRVTGQMFLECSALEYVGSAWLYDKIEKSAQFKFLAIDQVTDVHNIAAILRTCAFYKMDGVIVGQKSPMKFSPQFYRISSGACEYVPLVQVPSLAKLFNKLKSKGEIDLLGLSEEAQGTKIEQKDKQIIVLGNEERGISHAVERTLTSHIKLESASEITSLNVSVACAVVLTKLVNQV